MGKILIFIVQEEGLKARNMFHVRNLTFVNFFSK